MENMDFSFFGSLVFFALLVFIIVKHKNFYVSLSFWIAALFFASGALFIGGFSPSYGSLLLASLTIFVFVFQYLQKQNLELGERVEREESKAKEYYRDICIGAITCFFKYYSVKILGLPLIRIASEQDCGNVSFLEEQAIEDIGVLSNIKYWSNLEKTTQKTGDINFREGYQILLRIVSMMKENEGKLTYFEIVYGSKKELEVLRKKLSLKD